MAETIGTEVDTAGIADLYKMTRRYVTDELTKRPGFPPPSTNISRRTKRWLRAQVLEYKAGRRWP